MKIKDTKNIMYDDGEHLIYYNQWDMGGYHYKLYHNGIFVRSFQSITAALKYFKGGI